jgi:hypothetical protein
MHYNSLAKKVTEKGAEGGKLPGHGTAFVFAVQDIDIGTDGTGLYPADILARFDKGGEFGKIPPVAFNGLGGIPLFHGKPATELREKILQEIGHRGFSSEKTF